MRVELQPAFVLHSRPFRDTSLILDCLTEDYGRLSMVAKGARAPRSRQRQLCQPFRPLLVSWQGKSNLKTLTDIEATAPAFALQGMYLYCGFYVNELLTRILLEADPCSEIYQRYAESLQQLDTRGEVEPLLRKLEFGLLADLGYAIDLQRDSGSGEPIEPDLEYHVIAEQGVVELPAGDKRGGFLGRCLRDMALGDYARADTRRQAKQLTRLLLKPLLGDKPLKSRELFAGSRKGEV